MRKQKGITLIALVITVIIILILAGVVIATLTGDNGLLQKATTAKQENEDAKELELIKLAVGAAQVAGEGKMTTKNLNDELRKSFDSDEEIFENSSFYYYKKYRIYKDGKIEENELLPDEFQQVEYIESTGTQWINTRINASTYQNLYVKIKGNYTQIVNTDQFIFGSNKKGGPYILMGQSMFMVMMELRLKWQVMGKKR